MGDTTAKVHKNIEWKHCRVCKGDFQDLFSLGDIYINDFPYDKPTHGKCPIDLVKCKSCELVQLRHTAPQELLYSGHYWYESGINHKIIYDLKGIAEIAMRYMGNHGVIIDVGANDGTLLSFVGEQYHKVGVEPATNLTNKLEQHADEVHVSFWEEAKVPSADVITAIGMMYDTDDPVGFLQAVKRSLKSDGIFIAQLMTAKQMVENRDLGNLCHEHIEFYTYKTLKDIYERAGLEIFKVEENDINGGSYRLFARHYDYESAEPGSIDYHEPELDWQAFYNDIEINKKELKEFMAKNPGSYYIYGASTKGNLIAEVYDLQGIEGAADANESKWGRRTTTGVPIVSEEEGRVNADYFIMMPYGFEDLFVKREREWLASGGAFLVPLPKFHVIEREL